MKTDIALTEIREIRHRMSAECNHDVDRFLAMLKKDEKHFAPQIERYHEIERQYQRASVPRDDVGDEEFVIHDKPAKKRR